jgi:hypothetical protein
MFERRHDPLLSRRDYFRRLVRHALLAPVVRRGLHKFHIESQTCDR